MDFLFRLKVKNFNKNVDIIYLLMLFFVLIIIGKLFWTQIIDGKMLSEKAYNMRSPANKVIYRGEILDRNGLRLASSATLYDIYAHPQYYKETPEEMATKLSKYLDVPYSKLLTNLKKPYSTITLAKNVQRETVLKIKKEKIFGIDIAKKTERVYPQKNLAAHILGYVNPEADLYAGVEKTASDNLVAVENFHKVQYTGTGGIIYDINTNPIEATGPLVGKKTVLTIDATIQNIAETELSKMIQKTRAKRGTVIVMNPKNGEVLGFAVLPSYCPDKYKETNASIIKNWVLSDVYPPGSTFKILTVASALEAGAISENERIDDTGTAKIQGWTITNYDYYQKGAPGIIDLKYLFEHSSNVGSLKVALKIPPYQFYNILRNLGFGSKTGIDLPGESSGIISSPKHWDKVTQATIGFGYSIAATPIQMASAVAAIANKGIWVTPHVIKYNNEESLKKIKTRRVLSEKTCNSLTKILVDSIAASKSTAGKIDHYTVAGKTGTSRKPSAKGGYVENKVYTSFVGFFPAKNPEVLIMVVVDDPVGADIWGSTVAGPVFNSVATQVSRILNIKPDKL